MIVFTLAFATGIVVDAGEIKVPAFKGAENGAKVLFICGSRPWVSHNAAGSLLQAGLRVRELSSEYLDGFGGSIKVHMSDPDEPTAFDGLTPSFDALGEYAAVMVNAIDKRGMTGIFNADRLAKLRAYVENGGAVVFTRRGVDAVGELLPVKPGKVEDAPVGCEAERPAIPGFAIFPEKLPGLGACNRCALKEGAEALSTLRTADGKEWAPYLVRRRLGRGYVWYLNAEQLNPTSFRNFANWAYAGAFFASVAGAAAGTEVAAEKCLEKLDPIPERRQLDEARASVAPAALWVQEHEEVPVVDGRTATFTNGLKLEVLDDGAVSVVWPKGGRILRRMEIPSVKRAKAAKIAYDTGTAEMTEVKDFGEQAKFDWKFVSLETKGYRAVVRYESGTEAVMKWAFKGGTLHLDGRKYFGFADAVAVTKCPGLISGVGFKSELTPEEPRFARRFSCYSPPRGYSDFDLSGKTTSDTSNWSIFGSGQPFELLVCGKGVYAGTPTGAEPMSVRMTRKAGADAIVNERYSGLGRVKAPQATEFWWHWYSEGPERGHNEYLALYQLVRSRLRQRYGLKELPGYPVAEYGYQLTEAEKMAVTKYAVEQGYRYVMPPCPESPIESVNNATRTAEHKRIKAAGADVRIWTAGSYTQGIKNPVVQAHPDWCAKDEKGEILQYGNSYPVFDLYNPEFRAWFTNIMTDAKNAGVKWVYRDMDGAAAGVVDYSKPESLPGIKAQIGYYRFFHDNNMLVGVEGMNPLTLDEYWYRKEKYTSFAGNEFCMVGEIPGCLLSAGLALDAFRTGMYACFPRFEHSGAAFGFDRLQDEVKRARRADSFTRRFNEALDICGMPFVRETEFGTVWTGANGGAIFFWNPVKKAVIDLPKGWKIRGVDGNVLHDVPGDAIYFVDK